MSFLSIDLLALIYFKIARVVCSTWLYMAYNVTVCHRWPSWPYSVNQSMTIVNIESNRYGHKNFKICIESTTMCHLFPSKNKQVAINYRRETVRLLHGSVLAKSGRGYSVDIGQSSTTMT